MLTTECVQELRSAWLPNMTDAGLARLIELLERESPLLVHGCFTRALPTGCLATHVAWNHPGAAHLTQEAGINWLHRVAGLNPATSHVIREWDRWDSRSYESWVMRSDLLGIFREEQARRRSNETPASRLPDLVACVQRSLASPK